MIVIIGESASGKSSIEKELFNCGIPRIVSYTSRPIRQNETNDVDYHFITKEEFEQLLSEGFFAERTNYNGWFYGIAKGDCNNNAIAVVEPFGFRQLKKDKSLNIISFYISVPEKERLIRIAKRGDNTMEIFRRIISDQGVFQGLNEEADYTIKNFNLQDAVDEIYLILKDRGII